MALFKIRKITDTYLPSDAPAISRVFKILRLKSPPLKEEKINEIVNPGDDCPPYLVFNDLENNTDLHPTRAKKIVRAIFERKYPANCPEETFLKGIYQQEF